jgi:hypothetical protein
MLCKTCPDKINGFIRPTAISIHLTLPAAMNMHFPNAIKNNRKTFTSYTEGAAESIQIQLQHNSQHFCKPSFPSKADIYDLNPYILHCTAASYTVLPSGL